MLHTDELPPSFEIFFLLGEDLAQEPGVVFLDKAGKSLGLDPHALAVELIVDDKLVIWGDHDLAVIIIVILVF